MPLLPGPFGERVRAQAAELAAPRGRHRLVEAALDGLREALRAHRCGCPRWAAAWTRTLAFLAAAAAGRHAGGLVAS